MPTFKESFFPLTYRTAQVQQIMDAILHLRSIAVFGLAGMGKSNIFRFLVAHPKVRAHYLGVAAKRYSFVFVDCNFCDSSNADDLLLELDKQLERQHIGLPNGRHAAQAGSVRHSIRARAETLPPKRALVILFDPLDLAFEKCQISFWAYLRGLRDSSGRIAYILGARRPPAPLPELQELLSEACWVPPLTPRDAFDSLARDAKRLDTRFTKETQSQLYALTGGHPGFLKNAAELVARAQLISDLYGERQVHDLLANEAIQEACRDLWSDLDSERRTLVRLGSNVRGNDLDLNALAFLERAGIVRRHNDEYSFFSPLFGAYVQAQMPRRVRIHIGVLPQAEIESWQGIHMLKLTGGFFQLLRAMAREPGRVFSRAELSHILYSGEPRFSAGALAAQIRRLRKALNVGLRPLLQEETFDALLPVRSEGYRLNLLSETGWNIEYYVS